MKLSFDDAIRYIHENPGVYLQPDKTGHGYICPVCGSGQGKKGTGITSKDGGEHFTCWAGCYSSADIIDIVGQKEGLDNKSALNRAFEIYGIEIDGQAAPLPPAKKKLQPEKKPEQDFTDYFKQCADRLQRIWTDDFYLAKRGISRETCAKFWIGYEPQFKTKNHITGDFETWEVLIIPTGSGSYNARKIEKPGEQVDKANRYRNRGEKSIFNKKALNKTSAPIFITEGEIDALSIMEAGGVAVGIGGMDAGKNATDTFLNMVKESGRKHTFIIAMDNEAEPEKRERVRNNTEKLQRDLNELGASVFVLQEDPYEGCKDANEALQQMRKEFAENIRGITCSLTDSQQRQKEEAPGILWEKMKRKPTREKLLDFLDEVGQSADFPIIPTGFSNLDMILDGGIHAELYTITAGTGTGKTNLILQIADQIAQQGHYVHFYNLEMATRELIARSIARHTAQNALAGEAGGKMSNAKSAMEIMTGSRWKYYNDEEINLIAKAVDDYAAYCDNIRFFETVGYIDTEDVRKNVEFQLATKGRPPVIIVDYLQMLSLGVAMRNKGLTERQAIDTAMLDLKQISRDYQTAVIIISAINRESSKKNAEVELESAKESGAIEYTSGVQLSLDFETKGTSSFDLDAEMTATPRRMKIKNLKSRHSQGRNYVLMDFYPRYSLFEMRAEGQR